MEKKLTNSGPLREPADKHSIYTIKKTRLQALAPHPHLASTTLRYTPSWWERGECAGWGRGVSVRSCECLSRFRSMKWRSI